MANKKSELNSQEELVINKMKSFFARSGFAITNKEKVRGNRPSDRIKPLQVNKDNVDLKTASLDSYTKTLWNLWKSQVSQVYQFEDRLKQYQEMDNSYNNIALIARATDLLADEITQVDTNDNLLMIQSPNNKLQVFLERFIEKIGLVDYLPASAMNLVKYGDHYWTPVFSKTGVEELLMIDPYDVIDRIEFTPHEVEKNLSNRGVNNIFKSMTTDSKLQMLIQSILEEKDYSSFFRSYLFGFQVGSYVLPPWRCIHLRNFQTSSFFAPFGTPAFIQSLASAKIYEMALGLQMISRQMKFPVDLYKLSFPNAMATTDKMEQAFEFLRQWENSGLGNTKSENPGIGERKITIKDLFEYEQVVPNIDLGRIDDIELLRDDIVISTGIPRNFIDPNNGSFGNSGISLTEQFKPFARRVYKYQSIVLKAIKDLMYIHIIQSKQFELKDINFMLSMPYPESQANNEIIDSQKNQFELANNILDGLKERLGGEIQIPVDVIKDVYKKLLPYNSKETDSWIDQFVSEREKLEKANSPEEGSSESSESDSGKDFTFESLKKSVSSRRLYEKILKEETTKAKMDSFSEKAENNRHYFSSVKRSFDMDFNQMEKIFNESDKNSTSFTSKVKLNEEYKVDELNLETDMFKRYPIKKMKEEKQNEEENETSEIQDNSELDELNQGEE